MSPARVVFVGGATGSGKSAVAIALARAFDGEVVNADSQQVYRGMDVGTGKPSAVERGDVPHHLFELAEPWEQLDAARWSAAADRAIEDISSRGRLPIVVGGTGLWLRALWKGLIDAPPRDEQLRARLEAEIASEGLATLHARLARVDPESAARIHATDPIRIVRALEVHALTGTTLSELHRQHASGAPRYDALHLLVDWPAEELERRLAARIEAMYAGGLLDETRALATEPRTRERLDRVMGYREALGFIEGRLTREEATRQTLIEHRRYAKRQRTWFRAESWWAVLPGREATAPALEAVRVFRS